MPHDLPALSSTPSALFDGHWLNRLHNLNILNHRAAAVHPSCGQVGVRIAHTVQDHKIRGLAILPAQALVGKGSPVALGVESKVLKVFNVSVGLKQIGAVLEQGQEHGVLRFVEGSLAFCIHQLLAQIVKLRVALTPNTGGAVVGSDEAGQLVDAGLEDAHLSVGEVVPLIGTAHGVKGNHLGLTKPTRANIGLRVSHTGGVCGWLLKKADAQDGVGGLGAQPAHTKGEGTGKPRDSGLKRVGKKGRGHGGKNTHDHRDKKYDAPHWGEKAVLEGDVVQECGHDVGKQVRGCGCLEDHH